MEAEIDVRSFLPHSWFSLAAVLMFSSSLTLTFYF